jgi:GntR family transcriptional regulator
MTPKRHQIAHQLRDRITSGDYPAGSKLPPLRELVSEFSTSTETIRAAVAALANEGLVTPVRGSGTIVRDPTPVELVYTRGRGSQVWAAQTDGGDDLIVTTGWETCDRGIADRLGLSPGDDVMYRVRHQSKGVQEQVAQIHEQWIPVKVVHAIFDATGVDLADPEVIPPTDLFTLMRRANHVPMSVTETITTRMPTPDEVGVMVTPPGVPVLVTYRVTRDAWRAALETSTCTSAGDRTTMSFTVPVEE